MINDILQQGAIINFILSLWPLWFLAAIILAVMTYLNNKKIRAVDTSERVLLLLEIPRTNDKKELAAEQMFASLHGLLHSIEELKAGAAQEHISFEIASIDKLMRFYISVPKHLQNFLEGQVYAQYPTVQIKVAEEDYANRVLTQQVKYTTEIVLTDNEALPINTFQNFEVDPLAAITGTLTKLEQDNEEVWIQIITRPIDDSWHKKSSAYASKIKKGKSFFTDGWGALGWFLQALGALFAPPEGVDSKKKVADVSERDKTRITAIEEKSRKLGYQVKVRIVYLGNDQATAKLQMQAMIGTFKQFNTTNLNGFMPGKSSFEEDALSAYITRRFVEDGFILNIEEMASLYHLPHSSVETPNMVWASSKTAEPPSNLPAVGVTDPAQLSPFGTTNFRGTNTQFGAMRSDRSRHMYIIGQTGVGKSGLMQLLTLSDVFSDTGFAVIDPHGDYATDILSYIPAHRIEDVVYFNPADTDFPIAFNPMEVTDPSLKNHISSELVGVLKRMFESWGPRLEYILRFTILALLDYPGCTMLDITRMLTEKDFRADVIDHVTDPVVRNFWTVEFASWNDKFASEAVAPVLNKVGAFTANPMVRNIIGQADSSINIRHIMDNGKILIVNLSRGQVGEDNAAIMGALMVTKIQLAAMSRSDIPNLEDRRPFYLYVDEFQNFATDSFATILSEARKYALNLTVANQYTAQMEQTVRDAVFGNVGTIISFRVGADDATTLQKYFEPQFEGQDLIQLHNRSFVAAMSIKGERTPAFSATTLNIPPTQQDHTAQIIEHSRRMHSKPKSEVEKIIRIAIEPKYSGKPVQNNHNNNRGGNRGGNNNNNRQPNRNEHNTNNRNNGKNDSNRNKSRSNKPSSNNKNRSQGSTDNKNNNRQNNSNKAQKASHGDLNGEETIQLR